jgi:RimJ/RimL family protein N-acetyltransferase
MGGADPENVTLKVLKTIYLLDTLDIKVKVITGPSNPNLEVLKSEVTNSDLPVSLIFSPQPEKMPELMSWADLAITAGGSTCWELAFMGVPSLIITVAENQEGIGEGLEKVGAAISLGWHEGVQTSTLRKAIKQLLEDRQKREDLSTKARKIVDGKGLKRILRQLIFGEIIIRQATVNDCKFLWQLANDPIVREASFHPDYIPWEKHCDWFNKRISDTSCYLFIATYSNNLPIGQIRFDISNDIAEISYSVSQMARGFGLGKLIIEKGIKYLQTLIKRPLLFQAKIKANNAASIRTVEGTGFTLKKIVRNNFLQINIYQLHLSKNMSMP